MKSTTNIIIKFPCTIGTSLKLYPVELDNPKLYTDSEYRTQKNDEECLFLEIRLRIILII